MTRTPFRVAIVAAFACLLLLPGVQMLTNAVPVPPLDENRKPAAFPAGASLLQPADAIAKLQAWFNDHYGFRALLIRAKAQMDYSLFGASDRLHIGSDGWLFYRSVIDLQEPQVETLTDLDLDRAVGTFVRLRDWLAARDIRLIVQTQQLKDKFYPEKLPREAAFARTRHRVDDFRVRMAAVPGLTYLDTTPPLMALKDRRQIFHKTDFHWNDPAAFETAQRLVDTIAALDGRPVPFWTHELKISTRRFSGGQAMFMPLFEPPWEMGLFVEPTWTNDGLIWTTKVGPFEWDAKARNPAGLLPTTVIFGDSFTDGMVRSGLHTYFGHVRYARLYQSDFAEVLRALPPDTKYLVVEFIEMALPSWIAMPLAE